jgi:hypothetical protein
MIASSWCVEVWCNMPLHAHMSSESLRLLGQYFSRSATQCHSLKSLSTYNPLCAPPHIGTHQCNLLAFLLLAARLLLGRFLIGQRHCLHLRNDIIFL